MAPRRRRPAELGLLHNFGLKLSSSGELVLQLGYGKFLQVCPELQNVIEPLPEARQQLWETFPLCTEDCFRSFETMRDLPTFIPVVEPVVALGFVSTLDIPDRIKNFKAVGPALG
ncbi:hypothetical protein GOZ90_22805 [Agrobacterium vitis]|uniref:Uncharacterized protein n=1 Tax=Agrobacterium vitis TaxID=373 RepID=A0A6L6VIQ5_AGRVI|nr:hypothetical protein [Agrobacterium vitis]MUZ75506.1 hypothetical protein [Agrobacterium vitis]